MKIIIHTELGQRSDNYAHRWASFLEELGHTVLLMNFKQEGAVGEVIAEQPDGVMWHYYHMPHDLKLAPALLNALEIIHGIPVWPNLKTRWHFDDKIAQDFIFSLLDVPKVPTKVFFEKKTALQWVREALFPLVMKLRSGAGAVNIVKCDSQEQAIQFTHEIFNRGIAPYSFNEYEGRQHKLSWKEKILYSLQYLLKGKIPPLAVHQQPIQQGYLYAQEYLKNNPYDIRITVIGNRAFGFIRYNRPDDFRASGSGNIDYTPEKVPLDAVRMAMQISETLSFQSMCYDLLYNNKGELVVNEMSYGYVDKAVHDCPGHWDHNLQWIEGNVWPQQAHVEDFIEYILQQKGLA